MEREFPPQVLLRNIPLGYDHFYLKEKISGMMKDGHSKGLLDPTRIIVRTDHAFLHFGDVHDAVRAQKHLDHYKFIHAIVSAHLIVTGNEVQAEGVNEPKPQVPSEKDFPKPSPVEKMKIKKKIQKKEKEEIKTSEMEKAK